MGMVIAKIAMTVTVDQGNGNSYTVRRRDASKLKAIYVSRVFRKEAWQDKSMCRLFLKSLT